MNAAAGEGSTQAAGEPATPGEMLRAERERRRLSLQQAAEDLHLDTWTIEALEENRFAALGAPVYAKGYLRKYAALLNLSPDVVIARYESLSDRPIEPTPIPASVYTPPVVERISLRKPLLALAAIIGAVVSWWALQFFINREPSTAPPVEQPVVTTQLENTAPSSVALEPPQGATSSPQETVAEVGQSDEPPPPQASSSGADGPQVRLRLEFSATSWTEVYDANDRRLMFDLGEPGRARTLTGVAPLRVTIGAASAVTAFVNDQAIVVPRREGRDATKFVVDAAGKVTPGSGR